MPFVRQWKTRMKMTDEKKPTNTVSKARERVQNAINWLAADIQDFTPDELNEDLVCKADEIARKWKACGLPYKPICDAVVEMAIWQKRQILKSAVEGCWVKRNRYTKENVLNGFSVTCDLIQEFKDGDKVKVIIIKEDGQMAC